MGKQLRILIVDDNRLMVKTLQDIFKVKGFHTETAYSAFDALAKLENSIFDCVISDIKMPDVNGVELYREIRSIQPNLPVVLMTAYSTDNLIEEGFKEGVIAVLSKPLNIDILFKFLSILDQKRTVVIVDDDPDFCKTLADILVRQEFLVSQVTDPNEVMNNLAGEGLVVLLDIKLQDHNGLDVLRNIRAIHPHLPVIMITGYREEMASAIETALKINAYTYLYKPLEIDQLLQVLTKIHHQELVRILDQPINKKM